MFGKLKAYFAGARQEFKHIQWPSAKTTRQLTLIVIVFSLVVAAYLGLFDYLFTRILSIVLSL
jgi:preprotein translocase SecE subunit